MKNLLLLLSLIFFIVSCKDKKETYATPEVVAGTGSEEHPGKALMVQYCYACHSPESGTRLAPPMSMVQMHYLGEDTKREEFVAAVINFVKDPSLENSKMPGAVRNFGLMPYQEFPDTALKQIADYLFDADLPEMRGHGGGMRGNTQENTVAKTGMEIAQATQQELGKNLMAALEEGGPVHALDFCNVKAIPLTSQMEEKYNARIKRVSDKNRNKDNAANSEEKYYINHFKQTLLQGQEPAPVVIPKDGKNKFYYPIVTNKMCLQCHGNPRDMNPALLDKIKELYPGDMALGYLENEVRGIWSIEIE